MPNVPAPHGPFAAPHPAPSMPTSARKAITLISHSMLFYWWPIWLLGYVLALMTYLEDHRLAIVPDHAKIALIQENPTTIDFKLTVPKPATKSLDRARTASENNTQEAAFKPRVTQKAWMGPVFCVVLLLTMVITNLPARGLWSFMVILVIIILVLVITLIPGGWDSLLGAMYNLQVYINMAGYLFIATAVFLLWAGSVFMLDRRTYMVVEPGQVRLCESVGASIRNIDATGLVFEKQRDDLFRHWILGFFSGDLIIHLRNKEQIRLPNVLWIGWKLDDAQRLLRETSVTNNP
jgi:hypothetical protein